MPETHVIEIFSSEWIRNTSFTVLIILLYLLIGKFLKTNDKLKFAKIISIILIITTLTEHSRNIINGYWNISENLPLQLCGISNLIGCFILFIPKNKTLFEFFYYSGIIGAIQAFLTPQINNFDGTNYEYVEYYISHGGILLLPIYMINNLGYELRKFSWLKVLIYLNILLIFIMPLNFKINSNYMYLAYPPSVDNPLIIGEWPYYIMYWEIIIVIFTYTLYVISTRKKT
ncbi:MAG: TIGR02206 family membrane protein [Flavobacteriaceae bacterium]|nr:TIGR02206 family membrane protein [Flavobacteriaceae bacterium]MBL6684637.1 TIGR02206 family membrane protein [Flavobacteriaceae bacterium]